MSPDAAVSPRLPPGIMAAGPEMEAPSFQDLLASLKDHHEKEVHNAVSKLREENRELASKVAAAQAECERLRKAGSVEDAPSCGNSPKSCMSPKRCNTQSTDWLAHPFSVNQEEPVSPSSLKSRRGEDSIASPRSPVSPGRASRQRPRKHEGTIGDETQAVETLRDVSRLRQACMEEEDEERRLAQKWEEQTRLPRMRMSYVNLGNVELVSSKRKLALSIVANPAFDAAIGIMIVGNAITIGVETQSAVSGVVTPLWVVVLENLFLFVYVIELLMRFFAVGVRNALKANWVKFDTFLVVVGVFDLFVRSLMGGESLEALEKVMLVRMLRLARLARTVRLLVQFRTLWLLVQGLMALTYLFAIVGMELIQPDPSYGVEYNDVVIDNFTNIPDAMMTLFQFFTLDSVSFIYRPILKVRPFVSWYFVTFILINSIALMNLITAIMVESSMRQANEDLAAKKAWENQKKKDLMPDIQRMFKALDKDGSGDLDLEEIKNAPEEVKYELMHVCNMDDLEELFNLLDIDDSGAVDITEFIDGIMRTNSDKPPELLRLMKQCADITKRTREIGDLVAEINTRTTPMPSERPEDKAMS
eukprot:TRINITY_DN15033_c0_g1_i1.p1 TRINITY_DN15033_c0_g1~~TRINITY_DN15033_c0_g1_i1.p1  ORF type:complete len:589 (-),score=116.29 TRINITY_DN15033_c0_g1_i1:91-1857(-)